MATKDLVLRLRLSTEEKATLRQRSEEAGLSMSEYVRFALVAHEKHLRGIYDAQRDQLERLSQEWSPQDLEEMRVQAAELDAAPVGNRAERRAAKKTFKPDFK